MKSHCNLNPLCRKCVWVNKSILIANAVFAKTDSKLGLKINYKALACQIFYVGCRFILLNFANRPKRSYKNAHTDNLWL